MHEAVGKSQVHKDMLDYDRVEALHATLGLDGDPPGHYDPLPPFYHQLFFWDVRAPDELGRDGHPKLGDFIPDFGLPRRMWAGGKLTFFGPLRTGLPAERTTTIEKIEEKQGRSGALAFVTLKHDIVEGGMLRVTEFQDIVYRADADPAAPVPAYPTVTDTAQDVIDYFFGPTLLFRYSALTFNCHRIHYDRDYAQRVEGYPGLVVHGPLLAQLLMLMASAFGQLRHFSYRAHAPLMDFEAAKLCRAGDKYWVQGPENRLCMSAEAVFA
ncbi:hypothetical protein RGUI_2865 [Rhodovulum sp. P5]|uniref:acyl dehydratase n=1 Tax=Rhodovulum sp. P5 TaxID=1564506 RepID=UPI0009C1ECAC|nr:acyl dehydratase [Rhodovulum sp. P5]ARE41006.1 hypothetical protein RGUI_2865 [Rhodovulum sp. P5]